jgi:hypothetical protein
MTKLKFERVERLREGWSWIGLKVKKKIKLNETKL